MVRNDILERLQVDPGRLTLGQLLQAREAAAYEIAWLRGLDAARTKRPPEGTTRELYAGSMRDCWQINADYRGLQISRHLQVDDL